LGVPVEMEQIQRWSAGKNLPGMNIGPRSAFLVILTNEQVNTNSRHWTKRQIENIILGENFRALENELPKGFMGVTLTFESSLSIILK